MRHSMKLSVSTPCQEKWTDFEKTKTGGFCKSCEKEVVDFTKMSDAEIIQYFKSVNSKTCGRFNPEQLKEYSISKTSTFPKWAIIGAMSMSLIAVLPPSVVAQSSPQIQYEIDSDTPSNLNENESVKGKVTSEGEVLPGVSVYVKGTTIGTVTDIDGYFEIKEPLEEGSILVFSFIGMETKEIAIGKLQNQLLEIPMVSMVCSIMGGIAVDRFYEEPGFLKSAWIRFRHWIRA